MKRFVGGVPRVSGAQPTKPFRSRDAEDTERSFGENLGKTAKSGIDRREINASRPFAAHFSGHLCALCASVVEQAFASSRAPGS
jgi:hypothetical protein